MSAWAVRQAAILTSRSTRRLWPPDPAVNAATNPGHQAITSKMTSGRSTRGSIAVTRLRRSTRLGGSGMATRRSTCSRPSSSTRTELLSAMPAAKST